VDLKGASFGPPLQNDLRVLGRNPGDIGDAKLGSGPCHSPQAPIYQRTLHSHQLRRDPEERGPSPEAGGGEPRSKPHTSSLSPSSLPVDTSEPSGPNRANRPMGGVTNQSWQGSTFRLKPWSGKDIETSKSQSLLGSSW